MIPVAALRVSASAGADGPVVALSGEADPTTAAVLRETLAAQLDTGARLVTVDASGLSFLDSVSVRVLVLAARALQGRHGRLVLARPQPIVARLLEITGADRLLDVRELAGPCTRTGRARSLLKKVGRSRRVCRLSVRLPGIMSVMQGFERVDRQLLDAAALAGHLVPAGSMFAFLAAHRAEVFPDADYADLFSPPGVGRPSLPATQMAAVLTLQVLHDYSDRETAEAVRFDVRWKVAIGARAG